MIAVYIAILILVFLLNYLLFKKTLKINSVFTFVWCTSAILSNANVYGLYSPTILANALIIIAICSVNIIYYLFKLKNKSKLEFVDIKKLDLYYNFHILLVLNIFAYIYSIPFLIRAFEIIATNGFDALRNAAFESSNFASTAQLFVFQWFVQGLFMATILIASCLIPVKSNKTYKVVIIAMLDAALYSILFAGRGIIVTLVTYLLLSIFIVNNEKITSTVKAIFKKKIVLIIILISFIYTIFITNKRTTLGGLSALDNLVLYFCGSVSFFSELIKTTPWINGLSYGKILFGGITSIFDASIFILFQIEYVGADVIVSNYAANIINIGNGIGYNALGTMLFPFMMDFGYFGVFIGPLFVGLMFFLIEKLFYKKKNLFFYVIFLQLYNFSITSIRNYGYYMVAPTITIILLIIICYKPKKIRAQEELERYLCKQKYL